MYNEIRQSLPLEDATYIGIESIVVFLLLALYIDSKLGTCVLRRIPCPVSTYILLGVGTIGIGNSVDRSSSIVGFFPFGRFGLS